MSNYINSDYYYNTFGGKLIPQNEFNKYAIKASNEVRLRILNKDISKYQTEVCNTTCLVADILYEKNLKEIELQNIINGTKQIITSEKVGDYSRNVSSISINDLKNDIDSISKKIDEEIVSGLLFTGLLYSGVVNV